MFFCDFHTAFFAHPINLKGLIVFYIFQGLYHIFKEDYKIPGQFPTKGSFFKFQEFSRTKVKFKDFSRSVRTLYLVRLDALILVRSAPSFTSFFVYETVKAG